MLNDTAAAEPAFHGTSRSLSIAVVVASRGRPQELGELYHALMAQTRAPSQIIFSVTRDEDLPPEADRWTADRVSGPPGLCAQRNRGLETVSSDIDVIAFFDDDYVPRGDTVEAIGSLLASAPKLVGGNGHLLADGIHGPGIGQAEALHLIASSWSGPPRMASTRAEALYGCNMAFRRTAIGDLRFDEHLPLYGWQEDIDFSAAVGRGGDLIKCDAFVGVHRGVKGARVSGKKFGFSQIVNPAYLARKGTMRPAYALKIAVKNLLANILKSISPEPWVDRRGRLIGNVLGLAALISGRADPRRIVDV